MMPPIPDGYGVRAPTAEDRDVVSALLAAVDTGDAGRVDFARDFVAREWARPGFDLATDAWVVTAPSGEVIGYTSLQEEEPGAVYESSGVVHPRHRALGIGRRLLRSVEARAHQIGIGAPEGSIRLQTWTTATDAAGIDLFVDEGYAFVREFRHLEMPLDAPLGASVPVPGIQVRPFVEGRDERIVHEILRIAFADHWGEVGLPFDAWAARHLAPGTDTSLWLVAEREGTGVGALTAFARPNLGWIDEIGVIPEARRRGVGAALLHRSIVALRELGLRATLNVDAGNESGALVLYDRMGMRTIRRFVGYEKRLSGPQAGPSAPA